MNKGIVRTRFAPSPTGFLHIGGLRTALYAYAWAKRNGGQFLLRLEDTDQARYVPGAVEQIIRSLQWAGIHPDEGLTDFVNGEVVQTGDKGPYIQSQRLDIYKQFADRLVNQNKAYYCFCTSERLEEMRKIQMASKQMPKYDRYCLALSKEDVAAKLAASVPAVIRFRVPEGPSVSWKDAVFGKVEFERQQVDDFIMMKADGFPTYNFANVVDDHTMAITHVIRAYEFLSSTPKHLLLYEALGAPKPVFAHASHILGKDKKKLSKRHAAVSVDEYRKAGYLPAALLNFIALLGWTHPKQQEVFSLDEMVRVFDIEDLHKSGAVFDTEKSLWMNGQYIRKLSAAQLTDLCLPMLVESGIVSQSADGSYVVTATKKSLNKNVIQAILSTEQSRIKRLDQVVEAVRFFFEPIQDYDPKILVWKKGKKEDLLPIFADITAELSVITEKDWTAEHIQTKLKALVDRTGRGVGDVFWPLRVALTGKEHSPSPQDVAAVLGKEESLQRIDRAVALASS